MSKLNLDTMVYDSILYGYNGFNDMTVSRTIAALLNRMSIPTVESGGIIKFRPKGASTFGGYIYKSGVITIFNDHLAPFGSNKVSFRDVLKTLMRRSSYGYAALYKRMERDRAMYLLSIGKKYEDVYGYEDEIIAGAEDSGRKIIVGSEAIPEESVTSYMDLRLPFRNSIFDKLDSDETTLWSIFELITDRGVKGKALSQKTDAARKDNQKLSLPVIYPNYHTFNDEGKRYIVPNRCVCLDFDLVKQGIVGTKAEHLRAKVSCMAETICVSSSFTKGNFWALVAIGDYRADYRSFANAVCDDIERRLEVYHVELDRACCTLKQARVLVSDKTAVIKSPSNRFFEPEY